MKECQNNADLVDLLLTKDGCFKERIDVNLQADFGITPLEAQACNTPVIAYGKGGALETVSNSTGIFFEAQNIDSLSEAVVKMENNWKNFSPQSFENQISRFGRDLFKNQIANVIQQEYKKWKY